MSFCNFSDRTWDRRSRVKGQEREILEAEAGVLNSENESESKQEARQRPLSERPAHSHNFSSLTLGEELKDESSSEVLLTAYSSCDSSSSFSSL